MIHRLPAGFQRLLDNKETIARLTGASARSGGTWEMTFGKCYQSEAQIRESTDKMAAAFLSDCYYGDRPERPPYLADITDFSQIICFAEDSEGAPFCFDYRNQIPEPKIVHWDGYAWLQVSESFDEFLALFQPALPNS
ncbi:MAG: SMI1/KNR4 family protein [Spirochaetia bacterium]|nr:SMI1/KNR4 family protein [Spirochaetia bacterium]